VGNDHVKWGKILEKGVGGGEAACDYSAVNFVDSFLILECHKRRETSPGYRIDKRFLLVQKRSNSLKVPQKVEAIELCIP